MPRQVWTVTSDIQSFPMGSSVCGCQTEPQPEATCRSEAGRGQPPGGKKGWGRGPGRGRGPRAGLPVRGPRASWGREQLGCKCWGLDRPAAFLVGELCHGRNETGQSDGTGQLPSGGEAVSSWPVCPPQGLLGTRCRREKHLYFPLHTSLLFPVF